MFYILKVKREKNSCFCNKNAHSRQELDMCNTRYSWIKK